MDSLNIDENENKKTAQQWGEQLLQTIAAQPFEEEPALQCIQRWAQQCQVEGINLQDFRLTGSYGLGVLPQYTMLKAKLVMRYMASVVSGDLINEEQVKKLIVAMWDEGVPIDTVDLTPMTIGGDTVLQLACDYNWGELIKVCLERGANLAPLCSSGKTVLMAAASSGHLEHVRRMVQLGADVNAKCERESATALHVAAHNMHFEVLERLIALGARVDLLDNKGESALFHAVVSDYPSLKAPIKESDVKSIHALLKQGADLNLQNKEGQTVCHKAAQFNVLKNLTYLIESGANFQIKDHHGLMPLDVAKKYGHVEVEQYLLGVRAAITDKEALEAELKASESVFQANESENSKRDIQRRRI